MDTEANSPKYGVRASFFHEAIYVGRINKAGTEFLDKEEATDLILAAVADYARQHFDGGLTLDFTSKTGKPGFTLTVTVSEHELATTAPSSAEGR